MILFETMSGFEKITSFTHKLGLQQDDAHTHTHSQLYYTPFRVVEAENTLLRSLNNFAHAAATALFVQYVGRTVLLMAGWGCMTMVKLVAKVTLIHGCERKWRTVRAGTLQTAKSLQDL